MQALPLRREKLRLRTWNVTGLGNREAELLDALVTYKLDILGVSKTWLKKGAVVEIPVFKWVGVAGENGQRTLLIKCTKFRFYLELQQCYTL